MWFSSAPPDIIQHFELLIHYNSGIWKQTKLSRLFRRTKFPVSFNGTSSTTQENVEWVTWKEYGQNCRGWHLHGRNQRNSLITSVIISGLREGNPTSKSRIWWSAKYSAENIVASSNSSANEMGRSRCKLQGHGRPEDSQGPKYVAGVCLCFSIVLFADCRK